MSRPQLTGSPFPQFGFPKKKISAILFALMLTLRHRKDIGSGALVASVNLPVDSIDSRAAMDRLSRALVARLSGSSVA